MEIPGQQIAGAIVLRPAGRLDGTSTPSFETTVLERLENPPSRLVLDLADIAYVSSAGLRVILLAAKRAKSVGITLAVCGLRDHIREVFELSGFSHVVAIHPSVEEALRS